MRSSASSLPRYKWALISVPVIAFIALSIYHYTTKVKSSKPLLVSKTEVIPRASLIHNNRNNGLVKTPVPGTDPIMTKTVYQRVKRQPVRKADLTVVTAREIKSVALDTISADNIDSLDEVSKKANRNESLLDSFYRSIAKQPIAFQINPQKDTTLNLPEGTTLIIPAFTLTQADGQPTKGTITFKVTEYYDKTSMVCNRLSAMSNSEPLITGGMLKLTAEDATGAPLKIRNGAAMNVQIPYKNRDTEMGLFIPAATKDTVSTSKAGSGKRSQTPFINWMANGQVQGYAPEPTAYVIDWRDAKPRHPFIYWNEDRLFFDISRECVLSKAEIKKKLEQQYPGYKIVIRKQWKHPFRFFKTAEDDLYGKKAITTLSRAKRYKLITPEEEAEAIRQFKIDLKRNSNESVQRSAMAQLESKYSFHVNGLGYVNCDRFYHDSRPKVYYTIAGADTSETVFNHCLVFHSIGALMSPSWDRSNLFQKIPVGEKVTLVSVCVRNNQTLAFFKTFTTDASATITPDYQPISPTGFRNKMLDTFSGN